MEDLYGIQNIQNLEDIISKQKEKMKHLREIVKKLSFVPVDPIGNYTCVTYKAIDGGKMNIQFNPFEMDLINIADSNGRELFKFVTPKGTMDDIDTNVFAFLDNISFIKRFLSLLGKSTVIEISSVLKNSQIAMDIAEYSCIFDRITNNNNEPILVMKDGLLRTKSIKQELLPKMLEILRNNKHAKLVGISKTSKLLNLISSALYIEKIFPGDKVGYVEIPINLELMAYKWSGQGKIQEGDVLTYAFGKMYVAKLSRFSNLLVTVEIPYDINNDKSIYSQHELNEIFGHLIKDSMYSYPNLGYPQTIMRAHEKAAMIGFTASLLKDKVMEKLIDIEDRSLADYIRDYNIVNEIVNKGVLGGGFY